MKMFRMRRVLSIQDLTAGAWIPFLYTVRPSCMFARVPATASRDLVSIGASCHEGLGNQCISS